MRRGHAGIGGWRNENTRHFRPRTGGSPHFRPPARNFGPLENLRFPPPGYRGPPPLSNHPNQSLAEHHERSKYRSDHRPTNQYNRPTDRSHYRNQRSIFPLIDRSRHKDGPNHNNQYQDYYDEAPRDQFHVNSMGDIDDRHQAMMSKIPEGFGRPPILQWPNHPEMKRQFFDERNQFNKQYKHHDNPEGSVPLLDYPGHRPPSSDHYGGNTSSSIDNSNSFSRSVDDTVDIIRKRLQNRNESGEDQAVESQPIDHHDEDLRLPSSTCQKNSQETPVKKRIQRQRHDRPAHGESNCDKIKTTIVHELFKMDKDRIHKLMDNPSSSSKFEYAISSLITESQNSLNKHMRSVAEKSLSASDDFIHNDNNTIYEDTFMKQMQHILEPQDTVLLEDIKPLVLAELSKVLQLNEYDQPFQMVDDRQGPLMHEHQIYDSSEHDLHNYIDFSQNQYYDQIDSPPVCYDDYVNADTDQRHLIYDEPEQEKPKPLFERRPVIGKEKRPEPCFSPEDQHSRVNLDSSISQEELPSFTSERRHSRRSMDRRHSEDKNKRSEAPVPLFDSNAVPLSEEEDPFAELDQQYHVAVDHNFIDYNISSPQEPTLSNTSRSSSKNRDTSLKTPTKDHVSVKQEIENQLLNIAKSPLKLPSSVTTETATNNENLEFSVGIKQEINTEPKTADVHLERSENIETPSKTAIESSSRKRSVDQKPSHRKEKRKKSETCHSDSNQQILNKNIIINVNDCAAKDKQKCKETAKSIFNLFFSKDENSKEGPKDTKPGDKSNTAKYAKRKEPHRKSNEKEDEQKARKRSLSSSHSVVSPKDSINNNMLTSKTECSKTKLQSIDMFSEQPKKASSKHLSHKNTVVSPETPTKPPDVSKSKQSVLTFNKKVTKRHVSTQVIRKIYSKETQTFGSKSSSSRYCQTEKKKSLDKKVQTDPVSFEKSSSKATDTFERMKEIDMEIQGLLQEKFKLYSSLESNASCPSTIQNLGMTVLNVNEVTQSSEENNSENSGDAVVDDFSSIPVEELEQIAIESVNEPPQPPHLGKKTRKHKRLSESRANSSSPSAKTDSGKVSKAPNISLLEQILIDDRPLEDIISLDDLETTPVKPKKKSAKLKKKSHKKSTKLVKNLLTLVVTRPDIKDCSVVLKREDLTRYLKPKPSDEARKTEELPVITIEDEQVGNDQSFESNVVEETVVSNDIQFDMLDVSEDIIIGEMCEMKCEDKETERIEVAITEDIILDNSQSSEPLQSEGGPGDNVCKMYDYSTDENLRRDALTVSGHADAVLAIECIENNFVAACLDGNVYHFNSDGQLLATLRGSNLAVTCLTIVKEKYGTTVYTGSLDSRIRYFDLETGLEKGPECNVLSPIQTMDRAWDTIFVGTRTGFVLQFECKNNMLIPVSTVKFSDQSILALRAMKEGPRKVLLVAARSEDVTIKDAQTGLLLRSLQGPKMTVYTLLYEEGKVYCGTSSHQIHVFDYASGSHAGAHYGGKGAVCLRAAGGLLFAGCYDGCVYVYREGEPRPRAQLRGPGLMLLSLAVLGSKIIAGYKDRSLYIWKIPLSILQEMIL